MHSHGKSLAHRQPVVLHIAALLVKRVAGLVDGTCESLRQIFCLEAGGHTHVGWVRPSCEGMHRHVQAAAVHIKPKVRGDGRAHSRLRVGVEVPRQPRLVRSRAALFDVPQQRHQPLLDLPEDLVQAVGGHASLVVVQAHVIGRAGGVDEVAFFLQQIHPLLEHGRKQAEVALLPRLHPRLIAFRVEFGLTLRNLLGESSFLAEVAVRVSNHGLLHF
mmetsp:Transcript_30291/g.58226  ORF Transcript_30291/g.58226 Transcript_30291/m.58226 type:complete len:217 (+) Transcript_30291:850-1500(+)